MASFSSLTLSIYSIRYLFNFFSIKPLITEWIINLTFLLLLSPNSPEHPNLLIALQKDVRMLIGFEYIFLLISSIITFFFSTATILASAMTYRGQMLSLKDLLSKAATSLKRSLITLLYITLVGGGYIFLALVLVLPLMMTFQSPFALKALYILLSVSAATFYAYLAVVWNLALVISVVEENYYGIEALGRAARIVKGMELCGFLVNLLITMLSFIVLMFPGFRLIAMTKSAAVQRMIGLLIWNSIWMVRKFGLTACTVFYYQCKKSHGEEVPLLQGSWDYGKRTNSPLLSEYLP